MPEQETAQFVSRLRGLLDLFKQFKELIPILIEFRECFKQMAPDQQDRVVAMLAGEAETPEDAQKLTETLMSLKA